MDENILLIMQTLVLMKRMLSHLNRINDEDHFDPYKCPDCERMINYRSSRPMPHKDDCQWGQLVQLCIQLDAKIEAEHYNKTMDDTEC